MKKKERKKMMSKKDKLNLDLDFEELGAVNKVTTKPSKELPVAKRPSKSKLAGIVLSIPSKNTSQFLSKTIENCDGRDFVKWAKNVAYTLEKEDSYYDSISNRESAFIRILHFHRRTFGLANPNAAKTLH